MKISTRILAMGAFAVVNLTIALLTNAAAAWVFLALWIYVMFLTSFECDPE